MTWLWPATPCVSLGSRDRIPDWESCEFNHHEILTFYYLVKMALWSLPHGKDAWQLGLSGSCMLSMGQPVPVPAPHAPGPSRSTPHHS